jgi:hypothetical protein
MDYQLGLAREMDNTALGAEAFMGPSTHIDVDPEQECRKLHHHMQGSDS